MQDEYIVEICHNIGPIVIDTVFALKKIKKVDLMFSILATKQNKYSEFLGAQGNLVFRICLLPQL